MTRGGGIGDLTPANLYLHYVFDLWAERWRRREAAGDMIIVRYADDLIVGFEHESDARRFLEEMRERLQEFALSLHSEKTRLIEFGRLAVANRKRRGLGKPETFTFLGFTFICSKTRRGKFQIKRKSRRDRMRVKLPRIIARPTTRSPAACRRARVRQGQAFGGAEEAPSLSPLRATAMEICGRDGRMLSARVEQKNGMQRTTKIA